MQVNKGYITLTYLSGFIAKKKIHPPTFNEKVYFMFPGCVKRPDHRMTNRLFLLMPVAAKSVIGYILLYEELIVVGERKA